MRASIVLAGLCWALTGCPDQLAFEDTHVNREPSLTVVATGAVEGQSIEIETTASDPDGNRLAVTYAGFVTADAIYTGGAAGETKTIAQPVTCEDIGNDNEVTVTATDGLLSIEKTVTLEVTHTETLPKFTSTPPTTAFVGIEYSYPVRVEGGNDCDNLRVLFPGGVGDMKYVPKAPGGEQGGTFTWTPRPEDAGNNRPVKLIVVDEADQEGDPPHTWEIAVGNRPPAIDESSLPGLHFRVGRPQQVTLRAIEDDGQAVTWALIEPRPAGMELDPNTGELTWTPLPAQEGCHSYEIEVKDPLGATAPILERTAIVWKDQDNDGHCTSQAGLQCDPESADRDETPDTFCLDGYEDCADGDETVFPGAVELCNGASEDCDVEIDEGAADCCFGNTAPTIDEDSGPPLDWRADAERHGTFEASDAETVEGLVWSLSVGEDLGMAIDEATGELSWVPEEAHEGPQSYTVLVTDGCGAESEPLEKDAVVWLDGDEDSHCRPIDGQDEAPPVDVCATNLDCDDEAIGVNPDAEEVCTPDGEEPVDEDCDPATEDVACN